MKQICNKCGKSLLLGCLHGGYNIGGRPCGGIYQMCKKCRKPMDISKVYLKPPAPLTPKSPFDPTNYNVPGYDPLGVIYESVCF